MTYPSFGPPTDLIVLPARAGHRRRFSEAERRQIVTEAAKPGASVSEVARRYGVARRVICRWRQELSTATPSFVDVEIIDAPAPPKEGTP
jgi:transposase-like protein